PRVREDLGFIPLVTPTSQIVGTQAVLNVLTGERYKTIAKETAGILKGEYGHTPVPVNAALQARVLEGAAPVTCRPADLLKPELAELEADVRRQAQEKGIQLAGNAMTTCSPWRCSRNPASNSLRTATTRRRLS
ncbi:oxaloacetate decarboxylase, partial [Salmonella enterica subsp. enterica serovar Montevideo str. CASC_09SCPH15965]